MLFSWFLQELLKESQDACPFGTRICVLQEHVKILQKFVDNGLHFTHQVIAIARQFSLRISALQRLLGSLDPRGIIKQYKAQMRPRLKFDAGQLRALQLARPNEHLEDQQPSPSVTSWEHSRDVSLMVVCHKVQV